jgi:putative OPT family oligopeptide transporter
MNEKVTTEPLIPASQYLPELTFKVIVFSIILTIILAASNAYLALKIGMTISASIPASVMALGILRFFKNSNILESNMIQTAASSGEGVASAISYVLPAMIIVQIWGDFPYWETVIITCLGGILGVLFSIPLRRVFLNMPVLRFPEGTAIGNVLKVSAKGGQGLSLLAKGAGVGALLSFLESGLKIIGDNIQLWLTLGRSVIGFGVGFTPAALAAGYIVGIEVGWSLFAGFVVGWLILLPILGFHFLPAGNTALDKAMNLWSNHIRFVGVGIMLVGGLWTLVRLLKPISRGVKTSLAQMKERVSMGNDFPRTERDFPIQWTAAIVVVIACLLFCLVTYWLLHLGIAFSTSYLIFVAFCSTLFILIVGFFLAAICGYFAGLLGSSYSPISAMMITGLILIGLLYFVLFNPHYTVDTHQAIAGLLILISAVVASVAVISNENIQDLKAGQMVGATPWKQQFILCVGVIVSALVIAPVLHMLFNAYGIGGVFPRPGMDPSQMLTAPQANLTATLAKGLRFPHDSQGVSWDMIILGCGIAVLIIILDSFLRRRQKSISVLGIGLGIYIPPMTILPIVLGAVVNYFVKRKFKKQPAAPSIEQDPQQRGILLACGLVAGSSLMGVLLSIPFVLLGSADALAIMPASLNSLAIILGVIAFIGLCVWLYSVNMMKNKVK